MNEAIAQMLQRYPLNRIEDRIQALREILQEVALLGLYRSKFFEKAAFYGGTALRLLYNLDRFSEGLDFSLLKGDPHFDLGLYMPLLEREVRSFGFDISVEKKEKKIESSIQSAFLKAGTQKQLLIIETPGALIQGIQKEQVLRIKMEVDINPPMDFNTENKFHLRPVPFSVKVFSLPDLFAGKMHAVLCRRWKSRAKGRDWYDLVWYAAHHPQLHLVHLEKRMIQSKHLDGSSPLDRKLFFDLMSKAIEGLDIHQIRKEVEPFVKDHGSLHVWSKEFFHDVVTRIVFV